MEKSKTTPIIDQLKYAYMEARTTMLTEKDALNIDLTSVFWDTLKGKVLAKELLVIGARGEVRQGKSTAIIKIAWEINKFITKIGLNKNREHEMWKYIFSDQTEFLRFINGEERHVCIVIDEFSQMAKTGLNATTEEALFDYYSDVFAGQYIHRVTASPDIITDKNTNIILDVIGKNTEEKTIRCKLTYRDIITKQSCAIGYVDIWVGDLISIWETKARTLVEQKATLTIKEQKIVDYWKTKDFYVKYQVKKYKRMQLIKREGVRDIRDLEFADMILGVLNELQDHSKIEKIDTELVNITSDEVIRQNKRIYSILAKNEIAQKSKAILNLNHKYNKLIKKLNKIINPNEKIIFNNTVTHIKGLLEKRTNEQKKLSALYKEYMDIEK